jgi:pimeloyl-ACP methyl ester carboxylesterase
VPRVSKWLGELIERTTSTPPTLVGHLLGGAIAAWFASERSEKLCRLVLIDTFGLTAFAPAPEFGAAVSEFFAAPSRASHRALWRYCAHDVERVERDLGASWRDFEEYNVEQADSPAFKACSPVLMQLFGAPLTPERLRSIAVSTTLIWGRHDLATPLSVAQAASKHHGWPLHVIDNANDDPPFEQPEALTSVLRVVLASQT